MMGRRAISEDEEYPGTYIPSQEEIEAGCLRIQQTWDRAEEQRRLCSSIPGYLIAAFARRFQQAFRTDFIESDT